MGLVAPLSQQNACNRVHDDGAYRHLAALGGRLRQRQSLPHPRQVTAQPRPKSTEGHIALRHSHSMVAGGLLVRSYTTRETEGISLMIRAETRSIRSKGKRAQRVGHESTVSTARKATTGS